MVRLLFVVMLPVLLVLAMHAQAVMASPVAPNLNGPREEGNHPARCFGNAEDDADLEEVGTGTGDAPVITKAERQSIRAALVFIGGAAVLFALLAWRVSRRRRRQRTAHVENDAGEE